MAPGETIEDELVAMARQTGELGPAAMAIAMRVARKRAIASAQTRTIVSPLQQSLA